MAASSHGWLGIIRTCRGTIPSCSLQRSTTTAGLAPRKVAGDLEESIFQPTWSPDGTLYFVSDRTDWWNLYAERDGKVVPILAMQAEFGAPQWVFGITTYDFQPDGRILARYSSGGMWRLMRIDPKSGRHETLDLPYSHISGVNVAGNRAYFVGGARPSWMPWWKSI